LIFLTSKLYYKKKGVEPTEYIRKYLRSDLEKFLQLTEGVKESKLN